MFLAQTRQGGLQACRNELPLAGYEARRIFTGLGDQLVVEGALVSWLLT